MLARIIITFLIVFGLKELVQRVTADHLPEELPTPISFKPHPAPERPDTTDRVRVGGQSAIEKGLAEKFADFQKQATRSTTEKPVQVAPASTSKPDQGKGCEAVTAVKARNLLEAGQEVHDLERPTRFQIFNNTGVNAAAVLMQDGRDVALILLPPTQRYEAKIPSAGMSLRVTASSGPCVNWHSNAEAHALPSPDAPKKGSFQPKSVPLVRSYIDPTTAGVFVHSRFIHWE